MIEYTFLEKPPDAQQIERILALYHQQGWWGDDAGAIGENSAMLKGIVAGSHCFLTVWDQDTLAGMGRAISDRASDAYIQDVTVEKTYRGRGIGTEIVKRLVARLRQDGMPWIGLIAEKNSHAFYEPLGFQVMQNAAPMLNLITRNQDHNP